MDFVLTDDQRALADGVRRWCEGRAPLDALRRRENEPAVVDAGQWRDLAATGAFSLVVSEADGGLGLGLADAAVVFEELGRGLVPGPLVATALAAWLVGDDGEFRRRAMAGDAVVGGLWCAQDMYHRRGPSLVEHLGSLDHLVVLDGGPDVHRLHLLDAPFDGHHAGSGLDPLTPMWAATALGDGRPVGDAATAATWATATLVLTGAMCIGLSQAVLDRTVAYAKQRTQFGRAIGSFQAVKHICADMLVRTEVARAAVHAASVTADQPEVGDAVRAAVGAALLATEAAVVNAKAAVQVHGGMGFTWEVPVHLYLMRAKVLGLSIVPGASGLAHQVAARW